jgi:hypothetical protein
MKEIKSPIVADAGKVVVITPPDVFTKYPAFATTVRLDVTTACHAAPPETVAKDKVPEPSDNDST